ncbi:carboxymuconolactone decarboxylase family protein [Paenibacillus aurantius]|uniref:Carboxymuconolactone decarboxylase family protein n=1 Tax=Paenibacillus aurantius TaxID=2918900 RepID=A0AA96LH17_9BACL|nr:carboxymuconolactone decarboxylase family protein [Paenibacillus aurantius]WNQ12843.1 carboxymuconolactone decarboxylase family protein [Paenibacillus aurantius]
MIRYIQPVKDAAFKPIYNQIQRDFGLVGDIFKMHSPSPPLLAGLWAALRETQLVGDVPRKLKEAVAVAVSHINRCPFCVDAHSAMLTASGDKETAARILHSQTELISDDRLRESVEWALATRSPGSLRLRNPPFSRELAPEMIGTVVINHYINKMMDVLLNQAILLKNKLVRSALFRAGAVLLASTVRRGKQPGESLSFLPDREVPLPGKLDWAAPHPTVSRAFACFAASVQEAGESVLDESARAAVQAYLEQWSGQDPGMSRRWVDSPTGHLTGSSRTAARLALLTAVTPYQVDDELIQAFRSAYPEDRQLLSALSWASFSSACTVGSWCR